MSKLYNLAKMTTATTGTGTITLGSAVSGFLSFASAGVSNGDVVSYAILDGASSEIGTGTYTSSGTTLTRSVTNSTNSNSPINLSGSAVVYITPRSADILNPTQATSQTLAGPLITVASATGAAGFNLPQGSAPSVPSNGDLWTTSAGLYARINGTTVGPLISAAGANPGLVLLNTLTASSSATLDDTTSITASYDLYMIEFENVLPATDSVNFYVRCSVNGGASYSTTAYAQTNGDTNALTLANGGNSGLVASIANTAGTGVSGTSWFIQPNSTSSRKSLVGQTTHSSGSGGVFYGQFTTTGSAVNALRFMFSSGNIASGKVRIYGVKTS